MNIRLLPQRTDDLVQPQPINVPGVATLVPPS
jgi:hypothetical protein